MLVREKSRQAARSGRLAAGVSLTLSPRKAAAFEVTGVAIMHVIDDGFTTSQGNTDPQSLLHQSHSEVVSVQAC